MNACTLRYFDMVALLLKNEANFKLKDKYGETAFDKAYISKNDKIIEILLDHLTADINVNELLDDFKKVEILEDESFTFRQKFIDLGLNRKNDK